MGVGMPPQLVDLITAQDLQDSWNWLVDYIDIRPTVPGISCYFDNKSWRDDPLLPEFEEEFPRMCLMLGQLYIGSQFGESRNLIEMVHGRAAQTVHLAAGNLDHDVEAVLLSVPRFRNHLSEHLSFWMRLAVEKKQRGAGYQPPQIEFSHSRPNIQPEDKGPDGLYIEVAPQYRLEIQSVKNSIGNPKALIASAGFRKNATPTRKKLLDDLWLLRHKHDGLLRLEVLLDQTLDILDVDTTKQLRLGLIAGSSCNAVVVANTQFANENLFAGYEHITPEIEQRVATFLGAINWRSLAAETHNCVKQILRRGGFL
ncbi:MAG: hypothetical protein JNM55_13335 [Anaerolineales bacterium]|nr:hypothetical protein [Anaerolineales bacterium]